MPLNWTLSELQVVENLKRILVGTLEPQLAVADHI